MHKQTHKQTRIMVRVLTKASLVPLTKRDPLHLVRTMTLEHVSGPISGGIYGIVLDFRKLGRGPTGKEKRWLRNLGFMVGGRRWILPLPKRRGRS